MRAVADVLKQKIEGLAFVDKIAGLSQTMVRNDKRFPVACNYTHNECDSPMYTYLSIDAQNKSTIYFKDRGGISVVDITSAYTTFSADLELIGWFNLKKLGEADCDKTQLFATLIMSEFASIKGANYTAGDFSLTKITVTSVGQKKRDPQEVFIDYDYKDIEQKLVYPFDYIGITVRVEFSVPKECIADYIASPALEC